MATHPLTAKYPVGSTHRINVSTVRDDACTLTVDTPERLYQYWNEVIATQPDFEPDKECVVVVMLTTRMRPFGWHRVSLGSVNECSCAPREVFRPVIAAGAYGFCIMHNHPSGDPSPSRADESITRRLKEASNLLQIPMIDHVIAGQPEPGRTGYFSFREAGLI